MQFRKNRSKIDHSFWVPVFFLGPWFSCSQRFKNYLAFKYLALSVPDEGYSRNISCTLNLISTFLLLNVEFETL